MNPPPSAVVQATSSGPSAVSAAITDTDNEARTVELDLTIVAEDGRTSVLGTALVELD
jgi:hypothetical protein